MLKYIVMPRPNSDKVLKYEIVVVGFKTKEDANEWVNEMKISDAVDEELKTYGEGVLRTVSRGKNGGRKITKSSRYR